jgi:hypothetical protein
LLIEILPCFGLKKSRLRLSTISKQKDLHTNYRINSVANLKWGMNYAIKKATAETGALNQNKTV